MYDIVRLYDIHILQFWHHHLEDMGKEVQSNRNISRSQNIAKHWLEDILGHVGTG